MSPLDPAESLLPAPGRGQYDRALTRERRQAEQRERLLLATAAAFAHQQRGVSGVIALAGVGRNTFYEYFDDFAHALDALGSRALARLELACRTALERARTPIERLRAISRAWCSALLEFPDEAVVLLCAVQRTPSEPLSVAGRTLAAWYLSAQRTSRPGAQDPALAQAAAASAELFLLQALTARSDLEATSALVAQAAIRLLY
jgi:AcrR family transcriptional regulator